MCLRLRCAAVNVGSGVIVQAPCDNGVVSEGLWIAIAVIAVLLVAALVVGLLRYRKRRISLARPDTATPVDRSGGYTAIGISRYSGANNGQSARVISSYGSNWLLGHHGRMTERFFFDGWVSTGTGWDTNWRMFEAVHQGRNHAVDPACDIYVTGEQKVSASTASNNDWFMPSRLAFGAWGENGENSKCQVAEFMMFNGMLSDPDRHLLEGYLANKYGLTLPTGHPYKDAGNPLDSTIVIGGEDATVKLYWGDEDGGTDVNAWDNVETLAGTHPQGIVGVDLTGLIKGETYYYRAFAANGAGDAWAPSTKFFNPEHQVLNQLFFSEYAEGSFYNKYLEIYNPTGSQVDLSGYAYPSVTNAPDTPGVHEKWNTFPAGATIDAGGVYIILHGSSDDQIKLKATSDLSTFASSSQDDPNSILPYHTHGSLSSGDDGFKLVKGTEADHEVLDSIGDFQGDPGSGWPVAGVNNGTKDHTLVRKPGQNGGEPDWSVSAGTDTEDSSWIVHPKNFWDDLGKHTFDNPVDNQPGPDGSGVVEVSNLTAGRAHWEEGPVFRSGVSGLTAQMTFSATAGYLSTIRVKWPASLGTLTEPGPELSGEGFADASLSLEAGTILITGCRVSSAASGILTVSGFSTPAEVPAGSFGNHLILTGSSGDGNEIKDLETSPVIRVPVPVSTLRQNNGEGIPLADGLEVVTSGTVSAFANLNGNEGFLEQDGSGIQFVSGDAFARSWINEKVYIRGRVSHSRGMTRLAVNRDSVAPQEVDALNAGILLRPTTPTTSQGFSLSATVTGGFPPYTYKWNLGDGLQLSETRSLNGILTTAGNYDVSLVVEDSKGGKFSPETTFTVNSPDEYTVPARSGDLRVSTFNVYLNRPESGKLISDLTPGTSAQAAAVAEVIQRVNPDIVLLNEFDYDAEGQGINLFKTKYLAVSQNGNPAVDYPHVYHAPSNTGIPSGLDLDNDGRTDGNGDSFGYGAFPGQYGMVLLSKYPIRTDDIRTFQNFLWKDMPGALLPTDSDSGEAWFTEAELQVARLSSKSHWDVPVEIEGKVVHFLCSHPTPPVFDGPEDRNGKRNHDEIRFWADYVDPAKSAYIYDDKGKKGGLARDTRFVLLGDQNADPVDLDSVDGAIQQVLDSPFYDSTFIPASPGGKEFGKSDGGKGDPAFYTASFRGRVDYVLPSSDGLIIHQGAVFWPTTGSNLNHLTKNDPVSSSDHRLVWLDLSLRDFAPSSSGAVLPRQRTIEQILQEPEAQEGSLIQLRGLNLQGMTWDDSATLQTLVVTDGTGDLQVLKPDDAIFSSSTNPGNGFQLVGLLVQDDPDSPFDSGYLLRPRDGGDFSAGSPGSPVKDWISEKLSASDPESWQAVMLEDPDHDSIQNALEYVLGSNPLSADNSFLPAIDDGDDFGILLTRLKDSVDSGLKIEVLAKKKLADSWEAIAFETQSAQQGISQENLPDGNAFSASSFERVRLVPDPNQLSTSERWFFSVQVTID